MQKICWDLNLNQQKDVGEKGKLEEAKNAKSVHNFGELVHVRLKALKTPAGELVE